MLRPAKHAKKEKKISQERKGRKWSTEPPEKFGNPGGGAGRG